MKNEIAVVGTSVDLIHRSSGAAHRVEHDGVVRVYACLTGKWVPKPAHREATETQEAIVERMQGKGWVPVGNGFLPSPGDLQRMEREGTAVATDGCDNVPAHGCCCHGLPSWLDVAMRSGYA